MKKAKILISSLMFIPLTIGLASCEIGTTKLPTTQYEKVKFAFNGVEKSFRNLETKRNAPQAVKKYLSFSEDQKQSEALDTIYRLYESGDKRGESVEDLDYSQPPMVQFQYIKKVLEKVGDSYTFNTKYYDTITGDVYIDIETGLKKDGSEYKYNYTFGLAIDIGIDSNDLISADVSFDIKINKDREEYKTKWYVSILLDYDMTNTSPNYKMLMVTENDERELPYYNHYTYEYDYVEVKDSKINEWRKFCMDNSNRLIKDAAHQNFASYTGDDSTYNVDACSWFKNNVFYKNNNVSTDEALAIGEALFNGLNLNATDINADAFFNKSGTQNGTIKTVYNEFCSLKKEDIIYDLLTKEEYSKHDDEKQIAKIVARNGDNTGGAENYHLPATITISESVNGFVDDSGDKVAIHLWYVDKNDGLVEEIRDLSKLRFGFKIGSNSFIDDVALEDTVGEAYIKYFVEHNLSNYDSDIIIYFYDDALNVSGSMKNYISGDISIDQYVKPDFPKALSDLGIPAYEGEKIKYDFKDGEVKYLTVSDTDGEEEINYRKAVVSAGFINCTEEMYPLPYGNGEYYKKDLGESYLYVAVINSKMEDNTVTIIVWIAEKPAVNEEEIVETISVVGSFNSWDLTGGAIELERINENIFILENCLFQKEAEFKIVVNHDWGTKGGYGFDDIGNIRDYPKFFRSRGEEKNIVVLQNCVINMEVIIVDGKVSDIIFTYVQEATKLPN